MGDRNTSIVTGDNLLSTLFQRKAIKTLHEKCLFYALCEKFPLPQREGTTMVFNGWRKIAQASSTLAEASSNAAVNLSSRKVSVTIASYGRHCKITDLAEYASVIGPVEGAVRELTQSAVLTQDCVVQLAALKSGSSDQMTQVGQGANVKLKLLSAWMAAQASSFCAITTAETGTRAGGSAIARNTFWGFPVIFAASSTRLSSSGADTISSMPGPIAIRKVVKALKQQSVEPFANGEYYAVTHPAWVDKLYSNADYKQYVVNFAGGPQESMFKQSPNHAIHGLRVHESVNSPRYAASSMSCAPLLAVGAGALGVVEMSPAGFELLIKRPSESTTSDPYNLNMVVAYKMRSVAAVLNPSCGRVLLCRTS